MTDKRVLTQFEIDALLNEMYERADHDPPSKWLREAFREVVLPYFNAAEQEPWVDGDVVRGKVPPFVWYVRQGSEWHELPINTTYRRTYSDGSMDEFIKKGTLIKWVRDERCPG